MSAILTRCLRCRGLFMVGMVGLWCWPRHECPDGFTGAPTEFATPPPPLQTPTDGRFTV